MTHSFYFVNWRTERSGSSVPRRGCVPNPNRTNGPLSAFICARPCPTYGLLTLRPRPADGRAAGLRRPNSAHERQPKDEARATIGRIFGPDLAAVRLHNALADSPSPGRRRWHGASARPRAQICVSPSMYKTKQAGIYMRACLVCLTR